MIFSFYYYNYYDKGIAHLWKMYINESFKKVNTKVCMIPVWSTELGHIVDVIFFSFEFSFTYTSDLLLQN